MKSLPHGLIPTSGYEKQHAGVTSPQKHRDFPPADPSETLILGLPDKALKISMLQSGTDSMKIPRNTSMKSGKQHVTRNEKFNRETELNLKDRSPAAEECNDHYVQYDKKCRQQN